MSNGAYSAQERHQARVFCNMAFIGGFMGSYTIYGLAKGFGNGLTGNVVNIITNGFTGNWLGVFTKILAAVIYLRSIVLVTWLPKHMPGVNTQVLSLVFTGAAGATLPFIPASMPAVVGLYPVFFCMGFQWCVFPGAYGFGISSIFNTNNFRQFTAAMTGIYLNGDEAQRPKARAYGMRLAWFHLGVVLMCVLWEWCGMGNKTSLRVIPLCLIAYINMKVNPKD